MSIYLQRNKRPFTGPAGEFIGSKGYCKVQIGPRIAAVCKMRRAEPLKQAVKRRE